MSYSGLDNRNKIRHLAGLFSGAMREAKDFSKSRNYNDLMVLMVVTAECSSGRKLTLDGVCEIVGMPRTSVQRALGCYIDLGCLTRKRGRNGYYYEFVGYSDDGGTVACQEDLLHFLDRLVEDIGNTLINIAKS